MHSVTLAFLVLTTAKDDTFGSRTHPAIPDWEMNINAKNIIFFIFSAPEKLVYIHKHPPVGCLWKENSGAIVCFLHYQWLNAIDNQMIIRWTHFGKQHPWVWLCPAN